MPLLSAPAPGLTATMPTGSVRTERTATCIRALEWLVLLAVCGYAGFRALPRAWNHLNTDFPNYYLTARLLREGYSTRHIYEWIWLQRQKDRIGILPSDQPVVGFIPHTPFSAVLLWPLTYWPPLAAKHIWILCNLLLFVAIAVFLRLLTKLEWRKLALLIGLCYPALRNLEYGQYYIVILALLTAALYLDVRDHRFSSGVLVGFAAGLKVFPVFFALYFARKRNFRAVAGLAAGATATIATSLLAFGFEVHRTYLVQVLPWAMRGDAMDPYALSPNSLSAVLHKLFIFEPQWNPHPVLHAPNLVAILHPLLQLLVLLPCVYLASPANRDETRLQLEWSSFLVALLTISTLPASYHFTLLILPVAVLAALFLREQKYPALAVLVVMYLAIGFPAWPHTRVDGWWALAAVPRLFLMILLCCIFCSLLIRRTLPSDHLQIDRRIWTTAFATLLLFQVVASVQHQRGLYDHYSERIPLPADILSASNPLVRGQGVDFVAMTTDGYLLGSADNNPASIGTSSKDQLSHAGVGGTTWIEEAGTRSDIVRVTANGSRTEEVAGGQAPVFSLDGRSLAYLRTVKGRASLHLRSLSDRSRPDVNLTGPDFDVGEVTFLPDGSLIFAAEHNHQPSALYQVRIGGNALPLKVAPARYPAASPDGQWLAYSRLERGFWNLWLLNLKTGESRRLTSAECNDMSPTWQPDSKTLVYSTDCGRALWFTALNREQVLP